MKKKIFLYYMILILIGISVTGFFTSQLAEKIYTREVEQELKNTALLIKYQISEKISTEGSVDFNSAAKAYARLLNTSAPSESAPEEILSRVTFIDYEGIVLGESETDFSKMENHINRKEIREAIQGKIGKDTRLSRTLDIEFFYLALPLEASPVIIRIAVPLTQLKKIDQIIWYYTIIGIIAGLVLTALLAWRFSSSITRPVNDLITVSREISKGNYSKRVDIVSNDELGQLSSTFNEMALKLEKTVADLKDKNMKVDLIINSMTNGVVAVDSRFRIILINSIACELFGIKNDSEIMGTNIIELIRNNQINNFLKESIEKGTSLISEIVIGPPEDKVLRIYTNPIKSKDGSDESLGGIVSIHDITNLKKLEQIRTEFVSNVTHELKTPLTSIRGFIETLRSGAIEDRAVAGKFLEIIDIEAERLYMLINDILQLSEIESRQKDVNIGIYDLKSIIDEVISILQGVAEKKNVSLNREVDENITIVANKDKIKQMLINLMDNAIKYNIPKGSVCIKACKSQGTVVLRVKDTGIGIPPEHLSRIFERFYRVDKGRSRSMGGTGLGLSIVKHIVNLYNGDIKVSSQPGQGTEFVIQLPV